MFVTKESKCIKITAFFNLSVYFNSFWFINIFISINITFFFDMFVFKPICDATVVISATVSAVCFTTCPKTTTSSSYKRNFLVLLNIFPLGFLSHCLKPSPYSN